MSYDPAIHRRRSIRLDGYDYSSAGAYFISIVAQGYRLCLFGNVVDGVMRLNDGGKMVRHFWDGNAGTQVSVDSLGRIHVVMPNHVHGVFSSRSAGANDGGNRRVDSRGCP